MYLLECGDAYRIGIPVTATLVVSAIKPTFLLFGSGEGVGNSVYCLVTAEKTGNAN